MTAREFFGCVGLLAALFVAVTGGCTPDTLRKAEHTADKVAAVVQNARDASGKACDKALPACAVYFDAVRSGLLHDDDKAEIACAQVSNVCELVGAAGAP